MGAAVDCGDGMRNCMGPTDANGCMTADTCVPTGEDCPYYCPYMPPMDCGAGMISCPGPVDHTGARGEDLAWPTGMNVLITALLFPSTTAPPKECRTAPDQWTQWDA